MIFIQVIIDEYSRGAYVLSEYRDIIRRLDAMIEDTKPVSDLMQCRRSGIL